MNCANHPDTAAAAFCRSCGKPLCRSCARPAQGTIFCDEHAPPVSAASPYLASRPSRSDVSPGLAFLLGLIPGVGAIYNGQYAKGFVHVVIFGLLISLINSHLAVGLEPLFGLLLAAWYLYMPFEAYHTAKLRQRGETPDEFSSLLPVRAPAGNTAGAIILILLGIVFLLHNFELLRLEEILRFWPVVLIAAGLYMLYARLRSRSSAEASTNVSELHHEN